MYTIVPNGSRVIIKPSGELSTKSAGGLILSGDSVPAGSYGEIIWAGPFCTSAKVGIEAVYADNAGFDQFIDGELYRVIDEHAIIYFRVPTDSVIQPTDRVFSDDSVLRNE